MEKADAKFLIKFYRQVYKNHIKDLKWISKKLTKLEKIVNG